MKHPDQLTQRTHPLTVISTIAGLCLLSVGCRSENEPATPDTETKPLVHVDDPSDQAASTAKQIEFEPGEAKPNNFWWPKNVDLRALRHNEAANPYGRDFHYAAEFSKLNLDDVKADIKAMLTDSQEWWPADYGNYGPLMIRLAWHSAGTYRVSDGRGGSDGGQMRFEPLNSWPDNANLDKARRLLWPIKSKYGRALSWADLMVLTGTVAMDSMGFTTLGFAGGREDDWEADLVYWGPEKGMLGSERFHGDDRTLEQPLAAAHMGLIYVNPEGPDGNGDPVSAAADIRQTFARMAMNDEETVALIAGGHTFGKAHGAHPAANCLGPEPGAAGIPDQGIGWKNKCGTGTGADTTTSGLEGAWTSTPAKWSNLFFDYLFQFEWEKQKSPAGATLWKPSAPAAASLVPDAHDPSVRHAPMMLTTDLSLRQDPAYEKIASKFRKDHKAFEQAFAKAWFKLTHRDLGPRSRYLGSDVPEEIFSWQDPLPPRESVVPTSADVVLLKKQIVAAELSPSQLVRVAWASASSYRDSDKRGGANGARIRLAPQKDWAVNNPRELTEVLKALATVQKGFNAKAPDGKRVSLADLIVLAGAVGIEEAANKGKRTVRVPFTPGRVDASQEQTDVASFEHLAPHADAFRNFYTTGALRRPAAAMIDKADLLGLTVPEMVALVGGLRVLGNNTPSAGSHGVFTKSPGILSNDFFVELLDLSTHWTPSKEEGVFEGRSADGTPKWTATEADLVIGSNSELRAVAEVYASDEATFVQDFVAAWVKVMQADRFDLHR